MNTPSVSIVIPTFNRAHVIARALRSVCAQTFSDYEVVVVDDGSTDGTLDVVDAEVRARGLRLRALRSAVNRGAAHARNVGVAAAAGRFVAFLDADDEWLPTKLATQLRVFELSPPAVGLITTSYELLKHRGQAPSAHPQDPKEGNLAGWMLDFLSGRHEIVGVFSTLMFRRELFETIGGLDESLVCWEDGDFYCRAANRSEFAFIPEVLTRKHHSADSISENWSLEAIGVSRFWKKYRKQFGTRPGFRRYIAWHQHSVAIRACLAGDMRHGRQLFRESIRIWPGHIQPYVHLLLSLVGSRRYHLVWSRRLGKPIDRAVSVPN